MRRMFFHKDKKATISLVGKIVIVLAVVAILLLLANKVGILGSHMPDVLKCTSASAFVGKEGVCVPANVYCEGEQIESEIVCEKGQKCCFNENVVKGYYVGRYCLCGDSKQNVWQMTDLKNAEACKDLCSTNQAQYCPSSVTNPTFNCASNLGLQKPIACLSQDEKLLSCYSNIDDCLKELGEDCAFCRFDSTKCK